MADRQLDRDKTDESAQAFSQLLLKVTVAQVIGTLVAMTWFIGFYSGEDSWSGYISKIASHIRLGVNIFDFSNFFSSLRWPTGLDWSFTLPLAFSIGALVFQYGSLLFKWLDQRQKVFEWGVDKDEMHTQGSTFAAWVALTVPSLAGLRILDPGGRIP